MKRSAMSLTICIVAGCTHGQPQAANPAASQPTDAAQAVAYPSHAGEPANMYFEVPKDGKTYVLGYAGTGQLIRNGQVPAYIKPVTGVGAKGETIYVETDGNGLEDRLVKEYKAEHK